MVVLKKIDATLNGAAAVPIDLIPKINSLPNSHHNSTTPNDVMVLDSEESTDASKVSTYVLKYKHEHNALSSSRMSSKMAMFYYRPRNLEGKVKEKQNANKAMIRVVVYIYCFYHYVWLLVSFQLCYQTR